MTLHEESNFLRRKCIESDFVDGHHHISQQNVARALGRATAHQTSHEHTSISTPLENYPCSTFEFFHFWTDKLKFFLLLYSWLWALLC